MTAIHKPVIIILVCFIVLLCGTNRACAQYKDTTVYHVNTADSTTKDTVPKKKHHGMSKPNQAALMSAIIPGLGQIGHKDAWWHVPIIYAGFGVMGYFIYDNNNQYNLYRYAYLTRMRTNADTTDKNYDQFNPLIKNAPHPMSDNELLDEREYYRRNRDLSIIVTVVWYAANIIDAYVAAHLREFDISNNLSMRVDPVNFSMIGNQPFVTCGLKFNLK
jgi:hypothetical protein